VKRLIVLLIVAVAAVAVWRHYFAAPNPTQLRARAQQSVRGVVEYWLTCIMEKREFDMVSVSLDEARLQGKVAIDTLRREEDRTKAICKATANSPLNEPGKFRAALSSDKGTLMTLTLRAGERDGKFWVSEVVQE